MISCFVVFLERRGWLIILSRPGPTGHLCVGAAGHMRRFLADRSRLGRHSDRPWLVLIESNTSGTGRLFARAAVQQGFTPILFTTDSTQYPYADQDGIAILQIDTTDENAMFEACKRL